MGDWCIYDQGDDCIIVSGTLDEMADLIDTMAGNLIVMRDTDVATLRERLNSIK